MRSSLECRKLGTQGLVSRVDLVAIQSPPIRPQVRNTECRKIVLMQDIFIRYAICDKSHKFCDLHTKELGLNAL